MDEMNNVTMENETSVETAPVEVVPSSAVDVTYDEKHESDSGNGTMAKAGMLIAGAVGVYLGKKYGIPLAKKVVNRLASKFKKPKATEPENTESEEKTEKETSDEE